MSEVHEHREETGQRESTGQHSASSLISPPLPGDSRATLGNICFGLGAGLMTIGLLVMLAEPDVAAAWALAFGALSSGIGSMLHRSAQSDRLRSIIERLDTTTEARRKAST